MGVKVYFESNNHAEFVREYDTEEDYMVDLPNLEAEATRQGMIVTERLI